MELQYLAGHGLEDRDTVSDREPFGEEKKKEFPVKFSEVFLSLKHHIKWFVIIVLFAFM